MTCRMGIFLAALNPVVGSEQKGKRPVLVISDEDFNQVMPVVTILSITSLKKGRRIYPNEGLISKGIGGLTADSIILAHQIRTTSKDDDLVKSPRSVIARRPAERGDEAI